MMILMAKYRGEAGGAGGAGGFGGGWMRGGRVSAVCVVVGRKNYGASFLSLTSFFAVGVRIRISNWK